MDKMMSLYEFLGKAAGGNLGKEVYISAIQNSVRWEKKKVSNPKYTGDVMTYPKSFLDEYFKSKADKSRASELEKIELPPIEDSDDKTPF
jgi:hypothetical protein